MEKVEGEQQRQRDFCEHPVRLGHQDRWKVGTIPSASGKEPIQLGTRSALAGFVRSGALWA
eukprot:1160820-Pelagomonas_calceolata.AAC.6